MGDRRWDPRPRAEDYRPDDIPDPDDEPPEIHYRQRITALERERHYPETTPQRAQAIDREIDYWRRELDRAAREEHWSSGAGDRSLF